MEDKEKELVEDREMVVDGELEADGAPEEGRDWRIAERTREWRMEDEGLENRKAEDGRSEDGDRRMRCPAVKLRLTLSTARRMERSHPIIVVSGSR